MASKPQTTLFRQKIIVMLYEGFEGNATDMAIRLGCTRNTSGKVFREWNRMNKTEQGRGIKDVDETKMRILKNQRQMIQQMLEIKTVAPGKTFTFEEVETWMRRMMP